MKHLQLRSSDYEFLLKDFDEALKTIGYNGRKENYYSSNAREFLFFSGAKRNKLFKGCNFYCY